MRNSRVVALMGLVAVAGVAHAYPGYLDTFRKHYALRAGSALANAKCATCHATAQGGARNPYGKALKAAIGSAAVTEAALKAVESADSDGDGVSNGEEIAAGTLPGSATSEPSVNTSSSAATPAVATDSSGGLIPKHAFHPILVHFPIALFLFGAFLEVLGARGKGNGLREVAKWNLIAGAVAGWAAVPTGLVSSKLSGYELTPGTPVFLHFVSGLVAALLMTAVLVVRRKAEPNRAGYWLLLFATAALVGAVGHFGGSLVYG